MAFAWLRKLAYEFDSSPKRMPFIISDEDGEKNGRFHFHLVIELARQCSVNDCFRWQGLWKSGIATIRDYDPSQRGVGYVTKEWFAGANHFEVTKLISQSCQQNRGYVSKAVWVRLAQIRGVVLDETPLPIQRPIIVKKRPIPACSEIQDTLVHPYGKQLCGASLRDRIDIA